MSTTSGYEGDDERPEGNLSNRSYIRGPPPPYLWPIEPIVGGYPVPVLGPAPIQLEGEPFRNGILRSDPSINNWYRPYDPFVGNPPEDDCVGGDAISLFRGRHQHSNLDKKWKIVWPRDQNPRHGRWGYRDRIKDLATGKGPDIWIEGLHGNGPHHPLWRGWKTAGYQHPADTRARWTNLGFEFRQDHEWLSPIKAARREDGKKYDHRTRRYRTPQPGMWSDVVWSVDNDGGPWYFRDETGREWVNPRIDGGRFNAGWGANPFFGNLP